MGSADAPVDAATLLARQPADRNREGLLSAIRELLLERRQIIVVLDDDPTGTQSVRGVPVITRWQPEDLRQVMSGSDRVIFVLTNSRAMSSAEAASLNDEIAQRVIDAASTRDLEPVFVSRSDSTLRGHFPAETDALTETLRRNGHEVDAVVVCPCFHEAGRITVDDVHWVVEGRTARPAGVTEYAGDSTFGYRASNLRDWVEERTEGATLRDDVLTLTLRDVRVGGPAHIAEMLAQCSGSATVVVNAVTDQDVEVVACGALTAAARGKRFVYRTGPSFVRALGGLPISAPLTREDLQQARQRSGYGLIVVGSHTTLTTRQLRLAVRRGGLAQVDVDVRRLLDAPQREGEIARAVDAIREALRRQDVVLSTSRESVSDGGDSLALGRSVSAALVRIVAGLDMEPPLPLKFLVAKGGITSSDIATEALNVHHADVAGRMAQAGIPLWILPSDNRYPGLPFVIFPGNVGDDESLADVVMTLQG